MRSLAVVIAAVVYLAQPARAGYSISTGHSAVEGDSGLVTVTFTVGLDVCPFNTGCEVALRPRSGTAVSDVDFNVEGTEPLILAFPGLVRGHEVQVDVVILGDTTVERDETFSLELFNPSPDLPLDNGVGTATILDDDSANLTVSVVDSFFEGNGSADILIPVTVTSSAPIEPLVTIDFIANPITATPGVDYDSAVPSLEFGAGQGLELSTYVTIFPDDTLERDERFFVSAILDAPGLEVTLSSATHQPVILNDDQASLSIDDVVVLEPDGGMPSVTFTMLLTGEVDISFLAHWTTTDAEAKAGEDYAFESGTHRFFGQSGESATFDIEVRGDTKVELDETFLFGVTSVDDGGRGVSFADAQAVASLLNNDSATLTIDDVARSEGSLDPSSLLAKRPPAGTSLFTFTVTLDREVDAHVLVDYGTADGTATLADDDYLEASSFLAFSGIAGEEHTIQVAVVADDAVEGDEDFFVDLALQDAGGRNVTLTDASGRGTILDDDSELIFADGFESGDLLLWSSGAGAGWPGAR